MLNTIDFYGDIKMNFNIVLGIFIVCLAYAFLIYLIIYSKRTIDLIAKRNLSSLREIVEDLHNGK